MTEPGDGSFIADKGWPARKLYLSPEAIALMENHCKGTPLTMSAYVDMLIKRDLAVPARAEPGEFETLDEATQMTPQRFERAAALPKRPGGPPPAETTAQRARPGEYLGEPKKQPTKKDFNLDV